jgi:hypothetical protein
MVDRRDMRPKGRPPNRFEVIVRDKRMTAAYYAELARQARELRKAEERNKPK